MATFLLRCLTCGPVRIGFALALPFVTAAVQWELWDYIKPLVWFLFYPTVFFAPLIGGVWCGIWATTASAVLVWYLFMPPQFSFAIDKPSAAVSIVAFTIMGIVFSIFHEKLRFLTRKAAAYEGEARFRHLFDVAPVAMAFMTKDGVIADRNARFLQTFGYSREDVPTIAEWWLRAYPDPDYRRRVIEIWAAAVRRAEAAGEDVEPTEYQVTCKNGEVRAMMISGTAFDDSQLATFVDVSEIRRAMTELEDAKERAEAATRAKSAFLANMSHELRTPLNAIIGFSELLIVEEADMERREQQHIVSRAGRELLRLVQDILDFSKLEAGKMKSEAINFNLADELNDIATLFRTQVGRAHLTLRVSIAPEVPCEVRGDAASLRLVMMNLIGNALKFTPKGTIEISADVAAEADGDGRVTVVFQVTDSGIGIKPENQGRIFALFEQEDISMTRRFGGTGLGLAISKQLVTLMGGDIWLESVPGVGSRFSFTVVFRGAEPDVAESAETVAPFQTMSGASLLVVEDDAFSRKLLLSLLEPRGYRVRCAEDGAKALETLEGDRFDAILMDLQLPEISGIEVTRRVRSGAIRGCDPVIPVIAVSAYAAQADHGQLADAGITDYVSKPIDAVKLMGTLDRVLKAASAP